MEGSPVGWSMDNVPEQEYSESLDEPYTQKYLLAQLHGAGVQVRFLAENEEISGVGTRYMFDHAKYAVVDSRYTLVASENWKPSGIPSNASSGNRGWGVVVDDASLAAYMTEVFDADWSEEMYDVREFEPSDNRYGAPPDYFTPPTQSESGWYSGRLGRAEVSNASVTVALSPDNAALSDGPLLALLGSARESIYLELMSVSLGWLEEGEMNPLLEAVLDAATWRNCTVKVLLDSRYVNRESAAIDNYDVVEYINGYAEANNISCSLRAALVDLDALGLSKVHNKGAIVDSRYVLVSSINWNPTSLLRNREVALIVDSEEAAAFYTEAFMLDWRASNPPPVASIVSLPPVAAGELFTLDASATHGGGDIVSYGWDVDGDGVCELWGERVTWRFKEPGTHVIVLNVTDTEGNWALAQTTVTVESEAGLGIPLLPVLAVLAPVVLVIAIVLYSRRKRGRGSPETDGEKEEKEAIDDWPE